MLNTLLIAGCIFWLAFNQRADRKTGYIDTIRLFNEFNLKKDMEKEASRTMAPYQRALDSISAMLNAGEQMKEEEQKKQLQVKGLLIKREAEAVLAESNNEINEAVWKRLNPLIDRFGKEQGLQLLIGANGMGTILYGDPSKDLTADLIQYVNKSYAGKD